MRRLTTTSMVRRVYRRPSDARCAHRARPEAVRVNTYLGSRRPRQQLGQPNQIERGAREDQQPIHVRQPTQFHLADPGDRLQPPERGLNPWSRVLALGVPVVPCGPRIDRTAAAPRRILRDVRRETEVTRKTDKVVDVIPFVGPDGATTPRRPRA